MSFARIGTPRSYKALVRNITSMVNQKGPAFFDRTSRAASAIVKSGSDIFDLGPEQRVRIGRRQHMIQIELVNRSAVDMGRRKR